jgi:hypothetical protein
LEHRQPSAIDSTATLEPNTQVPENGHCARAIEAWGCSLCRSVLDHWVFALSGREAVLRHDA